MDFIGFLVSGLSELVRNCTGLLLNKEEQFSNWEKRPLRESQIIYAATDAYVLLDIFEIMKRRSVDLNINFETLVKQFVNNTFAKQERARGKKLTNTEIVTSAIQGNSLLPSESPFQAPKAVKEVKIVVDNMLQGV